MHFEIGKVLTTVNRINTVKPQNCKKCISFQKFSYVEDLEHYDLLCAKFQLEKFESILIMKLIVSLKCRIVISISGNLKVLL